LATVEEMASLMKTRKGKDGRRKRTGLLKVDNIGDSLDAILEDLLVLLLAHLLVPLGDGEEHENRLYGLLNPLEAFRFKAEDVLEGVGSLALSLETYRKVDERV
jgi:hypothetical protein